MIPESAPGSSPQERARAIRSAWARGAAPDALRALDDQPDLLDVKSVVVDLAYEEFCLRRERGEQVDVAEFCSRFPAHRTALYRLLDMHDFFGEHLSALPELLPERPLQETPADPLATLRLHPAAGRADWPEPGATVGDFELIDLLGHGAFARVYLARQRSAGGRLVALKLSRRSDGEANTLGPLRHPNVIQVHFAGRDPSSGFHLVCMEFRGEATLEDVIERAFPRADAPAPRPAGFLRAVVRQRPEFAELRGSGPLPHAFGRGSYVDAVVRLAAEVAGALDAVHRRGVFHRDLKPSNILLDHSGAPVLLDFNLAVSAEAVAFRVAGTMPYMAPEQLEGLVGRGPAAPATVQTDLFALGVILYQLLGGRLPFAGPAPTQPLSAGAGAWLELQRAGAPALRTFNRAVPRRLEALVHRCLAFDPAGRPASAAEVVTELGRCHTTPTRLQGWFRRRRVPLTALGGVVMALWVFLTIQAAGVKRWTARGDEHFARADYARAIEAYTEAIRQDPGDVAAHVRRGRAYLKLEKYFEARTDLLAAAGRSRRDGVVLAAIAYCCVNEHMDETEAIKFLRLAKEAGCPAHVADNNWGVSLSLTGRLPEARPRFRAARAVNPKELLPVCNLAYTEMQIAISNPYLTPVPREAMDDIRECVESNPAAEPEHHLAVARVHAASAWRESLKLGELSLPLAVLRLDAATVADCNERMYEPMRVAVRHLRKAQAGIHPKFWEKDALFVLLKWFPGYNAGLAIPDVNAAPRPWRLFNPVDLLADADS